MKQIDKEIKAITQMPTIEFACQHLCEVCGRDCEDYCRAMTYARSRSLNKLRKSFVRNDLDWRSLLRCIKHFKVKKDGNS